MKGIKKKEMWNHNNWRKWKGWVQKFLMERLGKHSYFMVLFLFWYANERLVGNWWMLAEPIDSNFIIICKSNYHCWTYTVMYVNYFSIKLGKKRIVDNQQRSRKNANARWEGTIMKDVKCLRRGVAVYIQITIHKLLSGQKGGNVMFSFCII